MKKYGKSLLSVAAAVAISSSMLSAGYLPLTSSTKDDTWILFGVNGIQSTATQASDAGTFSITDSTSNTWTDTTADEVAVTNSSNMATLDATDANKDPVEVRVNTSGYTYNETEPVRTAYVTDATGNKPIFSFTYKASLEGEKLEYKSGTDTVVYYVTLSSANTYNNPAVGVKTPATSGGTGGVTLNSLKDGATSLVDYNLSNNPPQVDNYDVTNYGDAADANDSLRMYGFDASSGAWELFDSRNSAAANDFETIQKGKGYWGKIDTNDDNATTGSGQLAGLVLGSSTIAKSDYTALNLSNGWNLISFDSANTEIRRSTTGMLAAINNSAGTIKLYDSSRNQSVDVTFTGSETDAEIAKKINYAISKAKVDGILAKVFDLKAFPTQTAGTFALISNKKFAIADGAGDNITTLRTLSVGTGTAAEKSVWDVANKVLIDLSAGNAGNGAIYDSRYGEYFLMLQPLTGAGTAENVDSGQTAKVNVVANLKNATPDNQIIDVATSLTATTANLDGATGITAVQVDVNQDGTTDYALMSSKQPFYVRDITISRVFKYVPSDTNGTVTVSTVQSLADFDITIRMDSNATATAEDINNTALIADDDGAGNIVVIANQAAIASGTLQSSVEFSVLHKTGGDNLSVYDSGSLVTSNTDLAKGAVKAVYAPNAFVRSEITNSLDLNLTNYVPNSDSNYTFTFNNIFDINTTGAQITEPADMAALVTALTTQLSDLNITVTTSQASNIITLAGFDLIDANVDVNATTSAGVDVTAATDLGAVNTASVADLTPDLKYNAVYTPNYVLDGPLYTMMDNGFRLAALVTGATQISDGSVTWESIDLTRPTSEWLDSQDYNLFETDPDAGYWAYLETPSSSAMSIANSPVSTVGYTTFFDGTTTTNFFSGNIDVELANVLPAADADDSVRVVATVGGQEVELTRDSASSSTYSGKINLYEITTDPITGANTDVSVVVADGLGNKIASTVVATIKNVKPATPSMTINANTVTITDANGSSAKQYYIFQDFIPEKYTAGDELVKSAAAGALTGACANATAVTISSTPGSLKLISVDGGQTGTGNGTLGTGNASDIFSIAYMPIAKSRVILSDYNDGGTSDVSVGGTDYNSSCESTAVYTNNEYGVTLTSETANKKVKVAYAPLTLADNFATPITMFVTDGTTTAKVDYPDAYIGKEVFIELDGKVYGYTFPTKAVAENSTDSSPISIASGLKSGVTF